MRISPGPLPQAALLQRYREKGAHTDCYTAEVAAEVTLEAYLTAFYNSWAFRPERVLLGAVLGKRAGAAEVTALAAGKSQEFSAWSVEDRAPDQILLCDYQGRTRSWLMVVPGSAPATTRLHFGSAVVLNDKSRAARTGAALVFNSLLWFHAAYSQVLLWAAARTLASRA